MQVTRWQDDPARADRIRGRLAEVAMMRDQLEARRVELGSASTEWDRRRLGRLVAAGRKGVDAAIGVALFDEAKVPVELIAEAAGVDVPHVEAVRQRIRA